MERATRQNTAIRAAIESAGRPLSPTEVLDEARRHVAALGLATVYRNLKALVDAKDPNSEKREKLLQEIAWNAVVAEPKSGVKGKPVKLG